MCVRRGRWEAPQRRRFAAGAGAALGLLLWVPTASAQQPELRRLGPEVNTDAREIIPLVTADGSHLYFVREGVTGAGPQAAGEAAWLGEMDACQALLDLPEAEAALIPAGSRPASTADCEQRADQQRTMAERTEQAMEMFQRIWISERSGGAWLQAERAPRPVNGMMSAWPVTALPDNNSVLVASADLSAPGGCFRPQSGEAGILALFIDETAECRLLAVARRNGDGWDVGAPLVVAELFTLSDRMDAFMAPGERALLLSLVREDSEGRDLYVSFPEGGSRWSAPRRIEGALNSPGDEIAPFLAPDGRTLYFASTRDGGQGGYDVWRSRRTGDGWLEWEAPVPLSGPVNTDLDQAGVAVDATGELAFLASGEFGREDIFAFELAPEDRPLPTAFVRGRVTEPDLDTPVGAGIGYERLSDGEAAGSAASEPVSGDYQIALPVGERYGFRAEAGGYLPVSDHVDLTDASPGDVVQRDLILVPFAVGETIRLNNIFFEINEAELLPESRTELERLARILEDRPSMRIALAGHTDSDNTEAYNQTLSENRARAVLDYLVNRGIDGGRLEWAGFGETRPVASNDTEGGKALNRRVEFTILALD